MQELTIQNYYKSLNAPLKSHYCIVATEPLQKLEAIQALITKAKQLDYELAPVIPVNAKTNWKELENSFNAASLFYQKKLIQLDFGDKKPTKASLAPLLEMQTAAPNSKDILLLTMDKIDKASIKTKWFNDLMQNGVFLQIWDIDSAKLPEWILQRSKKYSYQLDMQAAKFLADYSFGNLLYAASELEKLSFIADKDQKIDTQYLTSITYDASSYSIFDLNNFLIRNNLTQIYKILEYLKSTNAEKNLVLWAITKEIRLLLNMKLALIKGEDFDIWCKKNKIWRDKNYYLTFVSHLSIRKLKFALKKASVLDEQIKTSDSSSFWSNLLDLYKFLIK